MPPKKMLTVYYFDKTTKCNAVLVTPATRLVREDAVIFAYNGDALVGMFDLGSVDHIFVSEAKDEAPMDV